MAGLQNQRGHRIKGDTINTTAATFVALSVDCSFGLTTTAEAHFTLDASGNANDTLTYDSNGNLTYDGLQQYTYDAWNRLKTVAHAWRRGRLGGVE